MIYANINKCNLCETPLCLSEYEVSSLRCENCWMMTCYKKQNRLRRSRIYLRKSIGTSRKDERSWILADNVSSTSKLCYINETKSNPFHFACRQWYLYKNPQCNMV